MSVNLAIANIALDTATVSRQGFGTILFAGKHNYFSERVRSYSSTTSMVSDGIPTDSNVYRAALSAFSQTPSPRILKIGRQETTSQLTPTEMTTGTVVSFLLNTNDETESTIMYTVQSGDDAEAIVDGLLSAIAGDTGKAAHITSMKSGSGDEAVLLIRQASSGTDWFTIKSVDNLDETFVAVSTETAADTLEAIVAEDDDFYYYTAEDKSETFVLGSAAAVEARLKYYRTSLFEANDLLSTPTGTIGKLAESNYFRTGPFFHHLATTNFPEVAQLAEIAFAVTGTVTYANRIVSGVAPSQGMTGKPLTETEKQNLTKVNGDYFARVGNALSDPVITVIGKSSSGEYIDNIVGRDNMQVDIEADMTNLLIRQKASKIAFNNKGANQIRGVLQSVLNLYTEAGIHNFIEEDFEIIIPDQSEFTERSSRVFRQITFRATLTNAIHMLVINGTLSY